MVFDWSRVWGSNRADVLFFFFLYFILTFVLMTQVLNWTVKHCGQLLFRVCYSINTLTMTLEMVWRQEFLFPCFHNIRWNTTIAVDTENKMREMRTKDLFSQLIVFYFLSMLCCCYFYICCKSSKMFFKRVLLNSFSTGRCLKCESRLMEKKPPSLKSKANLTLVFF